MRRKNGCSLPLHPLQVASWVLFPTFTAFYGAIYLPYFTYELGALIPLAVVRFYIHMCVCLGKLRQGCANRGALVIWRS